MYLLMDKDSRLAMTTLNVVNDFFVKLGDMFNAYLEQKSALKTFRPFLARRMERDGPRSRSMESPSPCGARRCSKQNAVA